MKEEPVLPGQVLAGKYRIERVLGHGAMGMVLGATHLQLGSRVAVKVMLGGGKRGHELEERFLREARVAAMLRSEHAAKVLDMGTLQNGAPYLVMEFLDGQDLSTLLVQRGPLPIAEAVGYILQACEAIAEAHALGVVHRDIKPANLFLTTGVDGSPCIKVVDFGIAKQMDDGLGLTQTGAVVGSPLYMSPEQLRGARNVDARSDIWSLGATLYQLLAKTTPFHADTLTAVVTMVALEPPVPIGQYRPDVPPDLAAAITACLEKDPARRWQNVASFAGALAPYAPAREAAYVPRIAAVQRVPVPPPGAPPPQVAAASPTGGASAVAVPSTPASTVTPTSTTSAGAPPRPRSLVGLALLVVGLVLAIGVPLAIFFGLRGRAPEPSGSPAGSGSPPVATATAVATTATASASTEASASVAPPISSAVPSASASASVPKPETRPATVPARRPPTVPNTDGILGGSRR